MTQAVSSATTGAGPLKRALRAILGAETSEPVVVLRRRLLGEGTFTNQIVECRIGRSDPVTVFCKFGDEDANAGHGHRGGPPYEAAVYEQVLQSSQCTLPKFFGSLSDPAHGGTWLVIGCLPDCQRINKTADTAKSMVLAASWIGGFHAEQEARLGKSRLRLLRRYDRNYYLGWARRTHVFSRPLRSRFPWVEGVCAKFPALAGEILALPRVVVHGEYYPKNILLHEGTIYPVDWESAALGAGEIDLASLTEGWARAVTARCERAYAAARWPAGPPEDYVRRLALARIYLHLRWLGDRADWTEQISLWRFVELRKVAKLLGVLE